MLYGRLVGYERECTYTYSFEFKIDQSSAPVLVALGPDVEGLVSQYSCLKRSDVLHMETAPVIGPRNDIGVGHQRATQFREEAARGRLLGIRQRDRLFGREELQLQSLLSLSFSQQNREYNYNKNCNARAARQQNDNQTRKIAARTRKRRR